MLFLLMFALSVHQSVCHAAHLSSTVQEWLIKMMSGVNTPGGPSNIMLDVGPDTQWIGGGGPQECSPQTVF